ncbi:uncharacterized protein LOC118435353 [Folsomia candida]|uniref:uncharacterized protein LOC118435353 n=1 Tax=Folsomia candida TaxID=158441 RepID=UPI00160501CC|nr:uncharacterized protein LOC118435353 [Folsomia candida]
MECHLCGSCGIDSFIKNSIFALFCVIATTENRSQNESRATTPSYGRREPNEISFLSSLDKVKISHGVKEECLTCCQTLEFRNPENDVVMKATRKRGCSHQNYEIFHVITRELVILIEIDDGTWSCTVPNNIQIYGPPGRLLGSVNRYSACGSNSFFEVRNAVGDSIYTVEPKFQGCFGTSFGPTEYPIVCNDESNLKVAQVISFGCFCGSNLTVNFIEDLIPSKRALVIGFAMMVDLQHQIQVF